MTPEFRKRIGRSRSLLGAPAVPQLSPLWGYLCAPAATLLVFLIQGGLMPSPGIAPFVFFYVAVALVSWLGGRLPGLITVVLSALVANYAFVGSRPGWGASGPALTATLLFVVAGSVVALLCAAYRGSAMEAQRSAEAMQRQAGMLELSQDAILVWRPITGIEAWNRGAQDLYGFTADEARGRLPESLLATVYPPHLEDLESELRRRGRWEGELLHTTRGGRHVTVSARLQMVRGSDGAERVLETNRDITDRKRAEAERERLLEELRSVDQSKNEFLAMLSHELRNPLAPIRNSVYIMGRTGMQGEQARRALQIIDRQTSHLERLIDDLLDINRISRGKIRLQLETIVLNEIVRGAADDLRELFDRGGVRFEIDVTEEPLRVEADRTRIAQVVGNLLHNAAKFTPRGGWARLSLSHEGGLALIEVRDSGVGIEPTVLARIFEPFVQGERTVQSARSGLGLGLALVKGLVERHGGSVAARSEREGAVFTATLPLTRREAPAEAARSETVPRRGPRHILVIEDNPDAALSLKEALEFDGHVVEVALSGEEGVERARRTLPDVVFCDLGLPRTDGYEVARAIRADTGCRGVHLIALSGYALPEDVRRSEQAGFDRHLAKPPDLQRLAAVLAELPGSAAGESPPPRPGRPA